MPQTHFNKKLPRKLHKTKLVSQSTIENLLFILFPDLLFNWFSSRKFTVKIFKISFLSLDMTDKGKTQVGWKCIERILRISTEGRKGEVRETIFILFFGGFSRFSFDFSWARKTLRICFCPRGRQVICFDRFFLFSSFCLACVKNINDSSKNVCVVNQSHGLCNYLYSPFFFISRCCFMQIHFLMARQVKWARFQALVQVCPSPLMSRKRTWVRLELLSHRRHHCW